ncbi:carboxyl-terminal protease [unidentified eubacterium SCB49]|nr:carboxyl-terminal protease [unidentified eubacterium SCB49]
MKKNFTIVLLLISIFSYAQKNNTVWKSEIDFDSGIKFSTYLKFEDKNNDFVITSPKNADVRMFGGFKARIGRLIGKSPKKGIIIKITGEQRGDSLYGQTKIPVIGELKFNGIITDEILDAQLTQDNIIIGSLKGIKSSENNNEYTHLLPKIIEITDNNIYSKKILQTKEWKKHHKKLQNLFNKAKDDIELFLGFNMLSSSLSFSHYNLYVGSLDEENGTENTENTENSQETFSTIIFEEKNENTAYLKIKNFSSSQKELSEIFPKIIKTNYQNLIIDLRDNGGGGIDAAFEFAKHIVKEDIEVGYFVTNKLDYSGFMPNLFKTLPELQPISTNEFGQFLRKEKGAKLIFKKPINESYAGKLYVLTNKKTGSTCEPIAYVLKQKGLATLIGENTAGAMLAASPFEVSEKYILSLPIADFYTFDGVRLEGIGVKPNIETESEDALKKVMEIINK